MRDALDSDFTTLDGIVTALYDSISGTISEPRNWNRFSALFSPRAHLLHASRGGDEKFSLSPMSVSEYIDHAGAYFKTTDFFEKEIFRQTDIIRPVAHVLSTYETRHGKTANKPASRGVNCIQLFWDGNRWWITTVIWAEESGGERIPAKYLP